MHVTSHHALDTPETQGNDLPAAGNDDSDGNSLTVDEEAILDSRLELLQEQQASLEKELDSIRKDIGTGAARESMFLVFGQMANQGIKVGNGMTDAQKKQAAEIMQDYWRNPQGQTSGNKQAEVVHGKLQPTKTFQLFFGREKDRVTNTM